MYFGRSQWLRILRRVWYWTARTLGTLVRISLKVLMEVCFLCVLLSCVGTSLPMGLSPVQGALREFLKGFIASGVKSYLEQAVMQTSSQ